jgi:ABC-type branched-subunit amino acid transport system ATPase component
LDYKYGRRKSRLGSFTGSHRTGGYGYVLVAGQIAIAGPGDEFLANPDVGRLFLGG